MKNDETTKKKGFLGRISTLAALVVCVFFILFISVTLAAATIYMLIAVKIMPSASDNTILVLLVFMELVSLGLGTAITRLGGVILVKPLKNLIKATEEIARGNYQVRIEPQGTHEIWQLAVSFNEMTKELNSVETFRNDFVSNISHEFKTPIVSIQGFARLLKKKTLPDEKRLEYLDIIISESERISNLSSNVLLLSKLSSSDRLPETAEFSLDEQLRRTVLMMGPQFKNKHMEVHVNLIPVRLTGNEELLQHVWLNIIGNALKFTPENGAVYVGLSEDVNNAVVTISDTGIGVDEMVKQHMFDKFYQADNSRSTQGNGLGLALAKRIVDLSNGHIMIVSEPGQGTKFTITLTKVV